jgi:chitinase
VAPQVYQTERYGNAASFAYNVPVTNGTYTVNLDFAEIYWSAAGKRIFNVSINVTQVLTNFDIYAAAGGMNIALVKSFNVPVTNGTINITFTPGSADNPQVNGIEVFAQTAADTTPPSTPTGLSATAVSPNQINLAWTASTDNVGVAGYKIYRGGTQIATTAGTSYANTGLTASTPAGSDAFTAKTATHRVAVFYR